MNRSPDQPNGRTHDARAATTGTLMSSLRLDRLVHDAVDLARDDARLADGHLEAFAPHLFDEDRERELAAALHLPGVRRLGRKDAKRDVSYELRAKAALHEGRGQLVPVEARER